MKKGDTFALEITNVAYGGQGLGRWEGQVVFVPLAVPGDLVQVDVLKAQRRHAQAKIISILKPGPGRVPAPCPYYGKCGGCAYQHVEYALELQWKRQQVVELLQRIGKFEQPQAERLVRPTIASPHAYGYRNRITVHADSQGRIGFWHLEKQGQLVDVKKCPIALPEVNEALTQLRAGRPGAGHYSLRAPGISRSGFHQANQFLLEGFRKLALQALEPVADGICIEGYAGGGFFTGELARRFSQVEMIESDTRLVRDARRMGWNNVTIHEGRVEDYLPLRLGALAQENPAASASVLVDPPREGLAQPVVHALTQHPAAQLAYVTCDPATFARDAALLRTSYNLEWIQPIDLFPRTGAIECVSRWVRSNPSA